MQIFIYEFADKSLHLAKTEESEGDGIRLVFPKDFNGICHLGDESAPIKNGSAHFGEKKRRRGAYGVRLRTAQTEIEGDALYLCDGQWRGESSEQMCRAFLEIARLKDRLRELSLELEKLNDAVFRTVIF